MPRTPVRSAPPQIPFDVPAFLAAQRVPVRRVRLTAGGNLFRQGAPANHVFYIEHGSLTVTVVSATDKEAVIAVAGPGGFLGEGCLTGQPARMASASAIEPATALRIPKLEMGRLLREQPAFSGHFITCMLSRNITIEESLVDQLFNSSEKRLARTLLLLARYGEEPFAQRSLPKLSQEVLAEMVGTTRSRVNFFMNKFRKLGLIEYNGSIKVKGALLSLVLHD